MTASANVSRMCEAGVDFGTPSFLKEIKITLNNNLRQLYGVGQAAPVDVRYGECTVSGSVSTYFGDNAALTKFFNGTATSLTTVVVKDNQGVAFHIPRATYTGGGDVPATAKNTDVLATFTFDASYDASTAAHITCSRWEYYPTT